MEKSSTKPAYDQTKLDGISQLWGLPPDDLDDLPGSGPPKDIPKDETSFDNINQLWGRASQGPAASEERTLVGASSFDSINQLWDDSLSGDSVFETDEEPTSQPELLENGKSGYQNYRENDNDDDDLDLSAYEGFEWHDGGGDRLSQILADEVWDYVEPPEQETPITLEDYTKKVVEILEAAEDEILETEAILRAPPGADSVTVIEKEEDAEERVLQALNETTGVDLSELEDEDDLEALEMDVDLEEFLNATASNTTASKASDVDSFESEDVVSNQTDATSSESEEPPSTDSMMETTDISGDDQSEDDDIPTDDKDQDADEPEQKDEPDEP